MKGCLAHSLYDLLKDFQPTLAAAIALLAATLAYIGATSKVRLDKRIADRDFAHRKLGSFMRARFEIAMISSVARTISNSAVAVDHMLLGDTTTQTARLDTVLQGLRKTPAVDESWQQLQLLPHSVAKNLDSFRQHLQGFVLLTNASNYALLPVEGRGPSFVAKAATDLADYADLILADLDGLIKVIDEALT